MGLFDFFKKKPNPDKAQPMFGLNDLLGPTFLEGYTTAAVADRSIPDFEWQRKLQLPSGQTKFQIRYIGEITDGSLLMSTETDPILIVAIDPVSKQEILLFDGCKHGYNAMFCDTYDPQQIKERNADRIYRDTAGNSKFDVIISVYYQMDREEFAELVEDDGNVRLIDGSVVAADIAWRNSFDYLEIEIIGSTGHKTQIVSEELA
jgi:hypothetical protein